PPQRSLPSLPTRRSSDLPEALAATAHSLGEMALLNGDAEQAAGHFLQALELLRDLDLPLDRAETQLRAGVALAEAGERESAIERDRKSTRLNSSHQIISY